VKHARSDERVEGRPRKEVTGRERKKITKGEEMNKPILTRKKTEFKKRKNTPKGTLGGRKQGIQ